MSDRRKEIKRRLREIARDPSAPGAAAEAQRLTAEYKRLSRPQPERAPALERDLTPPQGLTEQDQAAVDTWPLELRQRLRRSSFNRVVDRASSVNDPDNWGALNDLRRR